VDRLEGRVGLVTGAGIGIGLDISAALAAAGVRVVMTDIDLDAADAPVGVSVVMPGMIRTGMNPIGRVEATTVAANVLDAIRRQRPYVFTDDHSTRAVDARLRAILDARSEVVPG